MGMFGKDLRALAVRIPDKGRIMSAHQSKSAMKSVSTDTFTLQDLQTIELQRYWALALLLFFITVAFLWLLFQSRSDHNQISLALFSHSMYILTSLVGAVWSISTAYRGYTSSQMVLKRRYCLGWLLIGLGLLANALGDFFKSYYLARFHTALPLPSYADLGDTLFSLLILTGLLLLTFKLPSKHLRIRLVLDAVITTLCLLAISWYLLFALIIQHAHSSTQLQTITLISYPGWDLVLLLAIVLFIYKRTEPVLRPALWLYGLGIFSLTWANLGFANLTSMGQYNAGMVIVDPFWFIGTLLIGISTLYQYTAIARRAYTTRILASSSADSVVTLRTSRWKIANRFAFLQSFLVYIPILILLVLTLSSQLNADHTLVYVLDLLCGLVIPICITRYLMVTYENEKLMREKEQNRVDADFLRRATASFSCILEMDLLLNHIVVIGSAELGFDAAALVVIDEYDRPLDEQSSLQARAATPAVAQVMSWHVTGKMIPYCTALMGEEIEVFWAEAPLHPMTLVHQWHIDQHIQSSLFVPLAYQGKIQGSLAFSLRTARHFTEHECYLANAFAAEVANALEHAHFYELARENALFAQGMSNVAARLNSVVATGLGLGNEIHQMICTEGVNALRADLAILYVQNNTNQFIPFAAVTGEPEPQTLPQEWPVLTYDDYNLLLLQASLPSLISIHQPQPWKARKEFSDDKSGGNGEQEAHKMVRFAAHEYERVAPSVLSSVATLNLKPPGSLTHSLSIQEALQRRRVQTAILAPLIIHQTPMGLLVLARTHRPDTAPRSAFAPSDLTRAQDFAGQASIAFTNARLYQQLSNAHQRMQELDKLKDQFMVTASHELRTPLTAVQGYLELLENYHAVLPTEQQHEFVQKASRGCDELVLLLNNVMDASFLELEANIHTSYLERVGVRDVVTNVVDLIVPQATQENRAIQISIAPHLTVKADPTRLRQIIRNLCANALKYSAPGTPLLFSAQAAFTDGSFVILSITDRGKGIRPQDQTRLFQRFVRLESDLNSTVRGSGLGLYISRRLVEAMQGKIWIESTGTPGAGSTFHIQLPMA
jgi:signal transduction histidine kinase